jgi:hypothetical protein
MAIHGSQPIGMIDIDGLSISKRLNDDFGNITIGGGIYRLVINRPPEVVFRINERLAVNLEEKK